MTAVDLREPAARIVQDILTEATARHWERRAAVIEWAAPKPGDFNGRATRAELNARSQRCREAAAACREHAQILLGGRGGPVEPVVWAVLGEVA